MSTETDTGPVRGMLDRDTVQCECGHVETISPFGEYKVVETGRYRWRVNPDTSEVWQEAEWRYICASCWRGLPDGAEEK